MARKATGTHRDALHRAVDAQVPARDVGRIDGSSDGEDALIRRRVGRLRERDRDDAAERPFARTRARVDRDADDAARIDAVELRRRLAVVVEGPEVVP